MKKLGIYSLLVASILFTGCSQKEVAPEQSSETVLNTIPDTKIEQVMDGSFELAGTAENGVYYMINGKKVLIENVYFGFDKYNLSDDMKNVAMSNASKLTALTADTTIKVSGNTDEWGTDEYNYALGLKRAKAVKDVLINNGVDSNVALVSYGESKPVCTDKNASCWQKNRRVEHTLAK